MAELRQIRTLRLGASRQEHVTRAAIALEDALRTASLPQLPRGAILLVRRLSLGRLPPHASPQWLSRHIETCMSALQPASLRARQDERAGAPAVWFADQTQALAALLATALHDTPRAWYWAGVLPGWCPGMTFGELLRRILRAAVSEGAQAGVGIAALLDQLLTLDRLDPVLRHLDPIDIAPRSGLSRTSAGAARPTAPAQGRRERPAVGRITPHDGTDACLIASPGWRAVLTRWVRQWGAADPRSRWLATHALIAVHGPAAASHAEEPIGDVAHSMPSVPDPIDADAQLDLGISRVNARNPGDEVLSELGDPVPTAPREPLRDADLDAWRPTSPERAPELAAADRGCRGLDAPASAESDWQPTRHAGLLLLLPAIARLEIAEADAEGDLCLCLLDRIADRLRIRKDDAIRRALPRPLPRTEPRGFVPPAAWSTLLRLPRNVDLSDENALLAACQLVLARFLLRYAKTSLRRLVRRPALVHATRTHIDLRFDARWAELDLRLAGLDLDPGWVPWLGRVVSFHYDYGAERP